LLEQNQQASPKVVEFHVMVKTYEVSLCEETTFFKRVAGKWKFMRHKRGPGGILALLIFWALLPGCAGQPQAAPTSPSPSKPNLGQQWTTQRSTSSQTLFGITWSGSQFVAVGQAGAILTSRDGRTWIVQQQYSSSQSSAALSSIVWSGSQFVVVGEAGTILTSP
jgi:photosystem II stability/assembly factor-like uncharacterized protein